MHFNGGIARCEKISWFWLISRHCNGVKNFILKRTNFKRILRKFCCKTRWSDHQISVELSGCWLGCDWRYDSALANYYCCCRFCRICCFDWQFMDFSRFSSVWNMFRAILRYCRFLPLLSLLPLLSIFAFLWGVLEYALRASNDFKVFVALAAFAYFCDF